MTGSELPARLPLQGRLLAWLGFVAVLAFCVAWVAIHAFLVDTVTVRICNGMDRNVPAERRMPVFLSDIALDGYVWNRHAEALGEHGRWRIHHTDLDNAPAGREVHWNSAFAWYLRGLGEIHRSFTGASLRNSIFRMSIWANSILLVLALGVFATLSARRFGPLSGAVVALGMVAVPAFYEGFQPAYPDHHGLIALSLLGLFLGIAWAGAGWVKPPGGRDFAPPTSLKQAHHGMIGSAVCGACGLWYSALTTSTALGVIGVAALASALWFGRALPAGRGVQFHAGLWKPWALWGAGGSLFFYLLEYFPSGMGMRLEVNHPLYALAWLGGGWMIATLTAWLCGLGSRNHNLPWRKLAWPLAASALLPAAIVLGGSATYIPSDPFMGRLWRTISELLPLLMGIEKGAFTWLGLFGWFPLLLPAAGILLAMRRVGRGTRGVILLLTAAIVLFTGLQSYQVRWGALAGPLYIVLAAIVIPQAWQLVPRRIVPRASAAVLLLSCGCVLVGPSLRSSFMVPWAQFRSGDHPAPTVGQAIVLLHREMARAIRDDAGGRPVVLLSNPNNSNLLAALGGFRTVGTMYWENVEGLKASAEMLNAQSDGEALRLVEQRGVTHVALMKWGDFIEEYFYALYPAPLPGKALANSFGARVRLDRHCPAWARRIPFPPDDLTRFLQEDIVMLRIAPGD